MSRVSCSCNAHGSFLTAKGLEEAAQRSLEGLETLAVGETLREVDRVVSVRALPEPDAHWDDDVLDEQHRRFLQLEAVAHGFTEA